MWPAISENLTSPRAEMVYNIDDEDNYAALRKDNWKYLTGSTTEGKKDGWYGSPGKSDIYRYDAEAVLSSETASAIAGLNTYRQIKEKTENGTDHFSVRLLNAEKLTRLRGDAQVRCGDLVEGAEECVSTKSPCLFDLSNDPCERVNLASRHPDMMEDMEQTIEKYRKTALKPRNVPRDANADPALYNNTWTNWQDWEDVKKQPLAPRLLSPLAIGLISAACMACLLVIVILLGLRSRSRQKSSRPSSMFEEPGDPTTVSMTAKPQMFEERELSIRSSFKEALRSVE